MVIAHATHVLFTATIIQAPRLVGERELSLVLGGIRTNQQGRTHSEFYQPAVALGALAGRLARLGAGEGLTGHGTLIQRNADLMVLLEEVARLDHPLPLHRTVRGAVLLENGVMNLKTRGMLMRAATAFTLEDGTPGANVNLGLTPRRKDMEVGSERLLIPLELAAYGETAAKLKALEARRYVDVSGPLQRRILGESRITRLEVSTLNPLHAQLAFL